MARSNNASNTQNAIDSANTNSDGINPLVVVADAPNAFADQSDDDGAESDDQPAAKPARKNAVVSTNIADDGSMIQFVVIGQSPITLDVTALADSIKSRALIHGLVQKVSDAAALGKDATPADKCAAMLAIVYRLTSGDWGKRSGEGSSSPVAGIIFQSYSIVMTRLAERAGKTITAEWLRQSYDKKDRKSQLALRTNPDIAAEMDKIRAAKSSVKVDDLMGELDGLD